MLTSSDSRGSDSNLWMAVCFCTSQFPPEQYNADCYMSESFLEFDIKHEVNKSNKNAADFSPACGRSAVASWEGTRERTLVSL